MATAGYSGTPLAKKLGIKAGHRVGLIGAPEGFETILEPLPEAVTLATQARGRFDVLVYLVTRGAELRRRLPRLAKRLDWAGGLWIGWPKKSSGVETDLAFDSVRGAGLEIGLVDNKVCAIDETWSGLRFVYRLEDRPAR